VKKQRLLSRLLHLKPGPSILHLVYSSRIQNTANMPQKSRIARKLNKLAHAYLKSEQFLLDFMIEGKIHSVSILLRGQRSLIDKRRPPFSLFASKRRFSISVESMYSNDYDIDDHAACVQDVTMPSPSPRNHIPSQEDRNSELDFLATYGAAVPPTSHRISIISPLTGTVTTVPIVEATPSELEAFVSSYSDLPSSDFPSRNAHTTRPVSFDPRLAMQALYAVGSQTGSFTTLQLPECLRVGTARPNASLEMIAEA